MKRINIKEDEKIVVYTPDENKYTMIADDDDIRMIANRDALENIREEEM